jgi:hypothetical protein
MILRLLTGVLAVWRLTHLLHAEDGPGEVFLRLRQRAGTGFFGQLLGCFYCLSLWVAVPVALLTGRTWKERFLHLPALSAGAILLEELLEGSELPGGAIYQEDEGS